MSLYYVLSPAADHDLEDIFDYTLNRYGVDQAVSYVNAFEDVFDKIVVNPYIGRDRSMIRGGLRSVIKDKHVVFYRHMQTHIRIVRVLHYSRDLPNNYLQEQLGDLI